MVLHPEGKEIAALLTPEAVEHLLGGADREGRSFFRVKGAKTHVALAGPLKLNKLTDQLDDIYDPLDLFFGSLKTVHKPYVIDLKKTLPSKRKNPFIG
jgi:hypothetical protein